MKRTLLAVTGALMMALAISACSSEECMTCSQNVYVNDVFVETLRVEEFCGPELIRYKDRPPMISGNTRTQWECE